MPLVTFAFKFNKLSTGTGICQGKCCAQPKAVVVISRDTAVSLRHSRVDVTRARSHAPARPPGPGPISSQVH